MMKILLTVLVLVTAMMVNLESAKGTVPIEDGLVLYLPFDDGKMIPLLGEDHSPNMKYILKNLRC